MSSSAPAPGEITDVPEAGREVRHGGVHYLTVKEGLAYILTPKGAPTSTDPKTPRKDGAPVQSVFYNPIQQFNRDLTVLAIQAFGEEYVSAKKRKRGRAREAAKQKEKKGKKRKRGGGGDAVVESGEVAAECDSTSKKAKAEDEHSMKEQDDAPSHAPVAEIGLAEEGSGGVSLGGNEHTENGDAHIPEIGVSNGNPEEPSAIRQQPGDGETTSAQNGAQANPPPAIRFTILDALSATGLRALRYAQELPFVTSVTANDLLPKATESIALNVKHNGLEAKIKPRTGNAMAHMYEAATHREGDDAVPKYQVVDLDPYGTAAPFLDAAVQALVDGGLLCVTCTDSAVFASNSYPEKAFSLYGGVSMKGPHSHEAGLRLVLHAISMSAARYGMAVEPLLSLSIDFYVRLFVRVRRSPTEVKFLAGKTMMVYNCDSGCGAWQTQFLARNQVQVNKNGSSYYKHSFAQGPTASPLCEHCGFKSHLAGPMYGGPIHNPAFVDKILSYLPTLDTKTYGTVSRIEGMLSTAREELLLLDIDEGPPLKARTEPADEENPQHPILAEPEAEPPIDAPDLPSSPSIPSLHPATLDYHPFFFIPSALAKVLHCMAPSEAAIKGALRHAGYRATRSHAKPGSIKTDAPWSVVWEIMREWVRQKKPVREGAIKEGTAGWGIMQRARRVEGDDRAEQEGVVVEKEEDGGAERGSDVNSVGNTIAETGPTTSTTQDQRMKMLEVVFDEALGRDKERKRLVRYQVNPRPNWGPMNRARGGK